MPAWPPPPAPIATMPSTPAAAAFSAKRIVVASWKCSMPASWTSGAFSVGSPTEVTMIRTP